MNTLTDGLLMQNDKKNLAEPSDLLNIVLSMLPLHAEEDPQRDSLSEAELIATLTAQGGAKEETALSLVYTLRRQFEALSLLDQRELRGGKWAFVSFPASLLGRSWLMALATPEQRLLPADYWGQGDARPMAVKEEQRTLLHRVEENRISLNPQAKTIRTVHVASAFIRMGDNFLLHHREDKKRSGEKSYVLLGGRFNLSDLPIDIRECQDILKKLFDPDAEIVARHINRTLERELEEETGLRPNIDYSYEPIGDSLPIYREVNGASNRHAYSSYRFSLFQIKLTHAGEIRLLDKVSTSSDALTWFSINDIICPQRADGASAYVDALREAWGDQIKERLSSIPDSRSAPLAYDGESFMLDLPSNGNGKFYLGKPGKEKPITLDLKLDDEEWQLLMLMGWHTRGFQIANISRIRLLCNGWMDISEAISTTKNLQTKIKNKLPGLLEIREDRYASLSISPNFLFFPAELFCYKISGNSKAGGAFRLERSKIETPWGILQNGDYEKSITGKTVTALRELEKGDDPVGDWERNLREQFGEGVKSIGLRRLWTNKGNSSCVVAGLRTI